MKEKIIDKLIQIDAIKFGEFTLKSGVVSPIYIDLRRIVSDPQLLKDIAQSMMKLAEGIQYNIIAGIPYTALPIATTFSILSNKPMVYARKEVKSYGTAKRIEGIWNEGDKVLIIDDLITSGESKFETFKLYEDCGLKINDVVVLIDREQGGKNKLAEKGYRLHSFLSVFEILDHMRKTSQLNENEYQKIKLFLEKNQF